MGLRAHFKQHWPTWLVGAIFAIPSFYFYFQGREVRDPVFLVDPNRTEIISQARVETAPIKVLRRDGRPVTENLYAVRFYFWNAGKRSIRPTDVLDTVTIALADSGEILDSKIISRSRPITGAQLRPHRDAQGLHILTVAFLILEWHDGFTGQIIYEGKPGASLRIAGTIEGVPGGIRDASSPSWIAVLRYSDASQILAAVVGMIIALAAMLFVGRLLVHKSRPSTPGTPIPREQLFLVASRAWRLVVLTTIGLLLVVAVLTVSEAWRLGKDQAMQRIVNSVPRSVLP